MQQIPQGMINQLEMQLKRINPLAYNEVQQAIKNNENPNEYLNKVIGGFNSQQKQQWDNMTKGINFK